MKKYLQRPVVQHTFFWIAVFACYTIANSDDHSTIVETLTTYTFKVSLQFLVAYTCLLVIIPTYLATKNLKTLVLSLLGVLAFLQAIVLIWRMGYLEPTYPDTHAACLAAYEGANFWERLLDVRTFLFINPATYFSSGIILIAIQYFQKQQKISELSEQKTIVELSNLKNQLNPHFLFNTLNNLYALAIKKSDKTPDVISRLSSILDYMLYRCNEKYVAVEKEVNLIEDYLSLEKIRYGKRVAIRFNTALHESIKIAPLLLLTFIENAFKHGVKEESQVATIDIQLTTKVNAIDFRIENTIPKAATIGSHNGEAIGLKNVQKQLALLYPNAHQLDIHRTENSFKVQLNIQIQ
ncbi:MAG: sensor histidine kinase [Bacteroidota bacterium]